MKKLLTIVLFVFIGINLYANDKYYAKLKVSVSDTGTGSGTVYVTSSENTEDTKSSTNEPGKNVTFTIGATPDANSYLEKWKVIKGDEVSISNNTSATVKTSNTKDETLEYEIAAVFQKVIKLDKENVTIVKTEGSSATGSVGFTVYGGADNVTPTITSDQASLFTCSVTQGVDNTKWTLVITASADAEQGHGGTITLQTVGGSKTGATSDKLYFTVKERQIIQLVGAPNGSYTASQTELGKTYEKTSSVTDTTKIELENDDAFSFKFDFAPVTNYRLNRLKVTMADTLYYLYDDVDYDGSSSISTTFFGSAVVEPEFIPVNYARFIVVGADTSVHYNDWERAFAEAKRMGKTVVSVYQPGGINVKTNSSGKVSSFVRKTNNYEWILPRPASGVYTVPAGYTLLVPGIEKSKLTGTASTTLNQQFGYTSLVGATTEDEYIGAYPTPMCMCKLIVEAGTTIEVNGNISIYSCLSATQGYTGRPTGYGQIHLEDGSIIQVNDGAKLHVLGYITGNHEKSKVVAKTGSDIYEAFQFTDWRGGNGMAGGNVTNFVLNPSATLLDNQYEVFPIGQYYVQSIETMLEMESGAVEWLTTAVEVGGLAVPATAQFINKMTTDEDLGLFVLGDNTVFKKYYDSQKDRLNISIVGSGSAAKLSYLYLDLKMDLKKLGGAVGGTAGSILEVMGGTKDISLDSRNYVIPINNNIDVLIENVTMDVPYKTAFMAGSSMLVTADAKLNIQNEIFVYDKELNVQPDSTHRGYYGSGSDALKPITYTACHGKAPGLRTNEKVRYPEKLSDATLVINGTLTMEQGPKGTGTLYTTTYDSAIQGLTDTSEDALMRAFGAEITSEGGGIVNFNTIGTKTTTNQIKQIGTTIYWVTNIPVCNAWLRNDNGTRAAGPGGEDGVQPGDTYMHIDGEWVIPDADLRNPKGNEFYITLPKDSTQDVVCEVVKHGVTINNISVGLTEGTQFELVGNYDGEKYKLQGDTLLIIPVKYIHTGKHNLNNPNTGKITVNITYYDLATKETKSKSKNVDLKGVEDYKPAFDVAIVSQNGDTVRIDEYKKSYEMSGFVGIPVIANVIITPAENNVAQTLSAERWMYSVTSPFTFEYGSASTLLSDAKLTYTSTTEGTDAATLTVTASYLDATPQPVDSTISITLTGNAQKSPSTLAFKSTMAGDSIFQTQTIDAIFETLGNTNDIDFTYTYAEGITYNLVSIEPYNGNYRLTAHEVAEVDEPQTVTIVATQLADNAMLGNTLTIQLTVLPPAAWNWGTLYFNSTTTTKPVITESTETWQLFVEDDPNNLIQSLVTDPINGYVATIAEPADPTQTYDVTFRFIQGTYQKVFTSKIYKDPRILPYCVDNERTFNDVTTEINPIAGVLYNTGVVSFASTMETTSAWTISVSGVPNQLKFTPLVSENAWRIEEWDGAAWTTTYNLDLIDANQEFVHSLRQNTQKIRIVYAAGNVSTGKLSNICVTALESVKANTDKVYIPLVKDAEDNVIPTGQKVVLYSVVDKDLTISLSSGDMSLDVTTLPAKTGAYTRQEVIITNNGNSEAVEYLYVKDGSTTLLSLPIRPFMFRQGLPIDLSKGDVERYYFLTTASVADTWANNNINVRWDATNKTIVFQNPAGTGTSFRSLTLAYEGAADYIQFHTSSMVDLKKWTIEESADGTAWRTAVDSLKTTINNGNGIRQELKYTTRYVRISYNNTEDYSKVLVTNLKLEGTPHLIVAPQKMTFTDDSNESKIGLLTLTAINLEKIRITSNSPDNFKIIYDENDLDNQVDEFIATSTAYPHALGTNKVGNIQLGVAWQAINTIDDAKLTIYNANNDSVLAVIPLLGTQGLLTLDKADETGVYTGIPDGTVDPERNYTYHGKKYTDYDYHMVDLTNAFTAEGEALFDYLFIYGETTPESGTNITAPEGRTLVGSNARTPYYVYRKTSDTHGNYVAYQFVGAAEANVATKATIGDIIVKDTANTTYINVEDSLRVYITGFAPYATTGYTKTEEGVFLFRGKHGAKLDVYLENCHIYSRNKTLNGNGFYGDKEGGETFSEDYARGSGGVLVFENTHSSQLLDEEKSFEVNIHTIGNNLLKSNYGCFYILLGAMKAYQISAPVHIHMASAKHVRTTKTTLNFDDLWPTDMNVNRGIIDSKRTNGYLGLKKQSNNAPSIDMGNPHTVVNFYGGQVELQNAQIVSENYKTTLAISHRSGFYGGDDVGIRLSFGIGTDSVGGTVNFYDGTTTVEPMWVKEAYKQYYLIDTLADGSEVKKNVGSELKPIYEYQTSCLRTPKNTYVQGGSHCFMRACQHVTSKGGAPKDKPNGSFLGQYIYTKQDGYTIDPITELVTQINFPGNVSDLENYYASRGYTYGLKSITPDEKEQLYFWIPDGYGGVKAEQDKFMSTWKACMTEIHAGLGGVVEGGVGGDTPIEPNEEVKYFLYCKIDQNMHNVINAGEGEGDDRVYNYKAPVAVPPVARKYFDDAEYTSIAPTFVSDTLEYQVLSDTVYTITDKVFYVTTATPDIWQTFTAPFDVAKIWVVETYPEAELVKVGTRSEILLAQAQHNADFAAFFAVAMAIGTTNDFETIYDSYKKWAWQQDKNSGLYTGRLEDYDLRGKKLLEPYYGGNWRTANYYLNHNTGNWTINDKGEFDTKWKVITQAQYESGTIMNKGETYSMLFPHSMQKNGSLDNRTEWDYWSGKLLIFESTNAPQKINGRDFLNDTIAGNIFTLATPATDEVVVTGNSTFARLDTKKSNAYIYSSGAPTIGQEAFFPNLEYDEDENLVPVSEPTEIWPTTAFLYGYVPTQNGMPAKAITRTGQIIYGDKDNTATDNNQGGKIPTVGGGNDLFITSTAEGINVAVAQPQYVRVLSASGAVLFSGMVNDNVDVAIYTTGVYVVVGENEVRKIMIE